MFRALLSQNPENIRLLRKSIRRKRKERQQRQEKKDELSRQARMEEKLETITAQLHALTGKQNAKRVHIRVGEGKLVEAYDLGETNSGARRVLIESVPEDYLEDR
jgi:septal ring factor EnvC (AmiA/AmiB activator)